KRLPKWPTGCTWFFVYQLASKAGNDKLAAQCVEKFGNAPFAFLRMMAATDALERCQRSGNLRDVIQLATRVALEMGKCRQRMDVPPQNPDPPELTAHLAVESLYTSSV